MMSRLNKKLRYVLIGVLLLSFGVIGAQDLTWMPVPQQWKLQSERLKINKEFTVAITGVESDRLDRYATRFLRRLDQRTGTFFNQGFVNEEAIAEPKLLIDVAEIGEVKLGVDESYELEIGNEQILLKAKTDLGAMRGLETLLQVVMSDKGAYYFPGMNVQDQPRFPWRGLMIDVSRHFQPVHVIKRNLDGMAAVKMNVLHLHLSDDHGFRVESKSHPKLHEEASDGEYFTHYDIKEIIRYAADRGIRIVPEFDVPGHATSWLTAYPELASANLDYSLQRRSGIFDPTLDPTNEKTYEILKDVFTEMSQLFTDEYFHIGGDENEGHHWDANEKIQQFMKANGIKSNHELQTYFNSRLLKILQANGKIMMGWDEILHPDLPKETVIHSWRGIEALHSGAKEGRKTVLSNGYYIDLLHPAKDHYLMDPLPEGHGLTETQQANILGGEATMWSELVTPINVDTRIWPRTAAIAERLWSDQSVKDVNDMYRRLAWINLQLEEHGLTHITSRERILRNLAGGYDVASLRTLANVASPLKGYKRNPGGEMYTTFSPYTLFADVTIADPPLALELDELVDEFLEDNDPAVEGEIKALLREWSDNNEELSNVIDNNPVLQDIKELSDNFSKLSQAALQSFDAEIFESEQSAMEWYEETKAVISKAREQGGRTKLRIVDTLEKLIKRNMAKIPAQKATGKIKVDGKLKDWKNVRWDFFTPTLHPDWNDTCHYAIQWDDKNLYLAFKVNNSNLQALKNTRDATGLHMDDGVEFLIDAANDKSSQWKNDDLAYHINILNAIIDDRGMNDAGNYNNDWNGSADTKVKVFGSINEPGDQDSGYQVEAAISWEEIGRQPERLLKMGINLCVNDRDDETNQYRYFDYMNLSVFHQPSGFAELILVD